MSWKEILALIVVPLAIAALPVIHAVVTAWQRRRQFEGIIFRELAETSPWPESRKQAIEQFEKRPTWPHHLRTRFVHTEILEHSTENRDFILSLPPDLVYHLIQLWQAHEHGQAVQWLHHLSHLERVAPRDLRHDVVAARCRWCRLLLEDYEVPLSDDERRRYCGDCQDRGEGG